MGLLAGKPIHTPHRGYYPGSEVREDLLVVDALCIVLNVVWA